MKQTVDKMDDSFKGARSEEDVIIHITLPFFQSSSHQTDTEFLLLIKSRSFEIFPVVSKRTQEQRFYIFVKKICWQIAFSVPYIKQKC